MLPRFPALWSPQITIKSPGFFRTYFQLLEGPFWKIQKIVRSNVYVHIYKWSPISTTVVEQVLWLYTVDTKKTPKCKGPWDCDKPRFWRTTSSNSRAYLRVKDKKGPRKRFNTERSAMPPYLSENLCLSQLCFLLGSQQIIGDHIGDWIRHYDLKKHTVKPVLNPIQPNGQTKTKKHDSV